MIDIHSHILSEVDDGARTLEESLKILQEASEVGFTKIISTSHYYEERFEKPESFRQEKLDELRSIVPSIELVMGSEILATPKMVDLIKEKKASKIGNTKYVLFELPFTSEVSFFNKMIDDLKKNKYLPILAHPERYEIVKDNPKIIEDWKRRGIYMQCNYESILGKYGKESEKIFRLLLKHELVDFLGSDVHRVGVYSNVDIAIDKIKKVIDENYFFRLSRLNQEKVLINKKIKFVLGDNEIKKTIFGVYK